jgi:hypothetical protein
MDRVGWNPKLLMVSYIDGHIHGREGTSLPPCDSSGLFEPKLQMYNRYCDENLLDRRNNSSSTEIENKENGSWL